MDAKLLQRNLLLWYARSRRQLPWRGARDPYAIWVSEVMLQQTQVATVKGYYPRFLARFPTLASLATASEAEVLGAWQGLGYYSRARRLHQGAKTVMERHGGALPEGRDALLALPGLGEYSAGAIASIAFGERVPVVDGNVVRVLTRIHALRGDPGRMPLRGRLWQLAAELVPLARPGDFNQALMELGATLCTPREPRCGDCPLAGLCRGRARGVAKELPERPRRAPPENVRVAAAVVKRSGRVLLVRVPDDAPRWAGLWVFPNVELGADETPAGGAVRAAFEQGGLRVRLGARAGELRYAITRFRMTLEAFHAQPAAGARSRGAHARTRNEAFFRPVELEQLALPSPHRKLARLVEATARAS